ncbi:glutathione synthetase ATP-binding domain-like protein [Aspergillus saccharolyticus JOP 1030-1]|uniref:Glutathione synthetase ATP-binding domain-like protein n=1 Tax=Aspergillus saccharolyticus JOP 1030-1 TaxID=1450539 RepID=A0A318ZIN0_9EURO|nr:glutathione synthetase ATP-binding domain-like protein [Aspergillus saccharolyticus JOP 1030-1]PYH44433.1 glutathione synthetase ATP-binding domain-like protein [Aspergillus saccharolyticus JOP 1030-1]
MCETSNSSLITLQLAGHKASIRCLWRVNSAPTGTHAPFRTFDLLLTTESVWPQSEALEVLSPQNLEIIEVIHSNANATRVLGESLAQQFLYRCIRNHIQGKGSSLTALKLLLPNVDGYILRKDLIQRRFLGCDLACEIAEFVAPRQPVHRFKGATDMFAAALDQAVGGFLARETGANRQVAECVLMQLELEATLRLSFPWIMADPLPQYRLAIVEGRPHPSISAAAEGPYRAASALGVEVAVLDFDGHWLQDANQRSLCSEFIVCDITPDDGLPDRIVAAVARSRGPIHGIITYSDKLLVPTAKAARLLGLWTNDPHCIEACCDKVKLRGLAQPGQPVLSARDVADLRHKLHALSTPLIYPLIIKPAQGCSSEGVVLVQTEQELLAAMDKNHANFPDREQLIEPYISGPEVDANLVLVDGGIVFSEINDDFPSGADLEVGADRSQSPSFAETATIMPSALPPSELALLESELVERLRSVGLQTGMFHIEARPSIFLIEINPRTPGHQESFAVEYTYGIDYYALYTLLALREVPDGSSHGPIPDPAALQALKTLSCPLPEVIQYPTTIVFIPVSRGGTFAGAAPIPASLSPYIPHYRVLFQRGETIPDPHQSGRWPFVAYFLVTASLTGQAGREQVRALGECIRHEFHYEIL